MFNNLLLTTLTSNVEKVVLADIYARKRNSYAHYDPKFIKTVVVDYNCLVRPVKNIILCLLVNRQHVSIKSFQIFADDPSTTATEKVFKMKALKEYYQAQVICRYYLKFLNEIWVIKIHSQLLLSIILK